MATLDDVYKFWNDRPCNVKHSKREVGTIEYFDEVAAKRYRAEPHILSFMDAGAWKGKRVLDIGCGVGTDSLQFANAGAYVTCVDLTESGLNLCRKNFETHGLQGDFYQGNIEELDSVLPDICKNSFDLIYSFGVIHHTPNPRKAFEKASLFLKPEGQMRCMVYSRFSYKLFWLMKENDIWDFSNADTLIQRFSEAQTGCPVTYTYTFDEVADLVKPHLNIKIIWKDHIFLYDIEKYKQGLFEYDKPFEGMSEEYRKAMCKELGWHTLMVLTKS